MFANTFVCEVEFLGGPIDGHMEALLLPLHTYVGVKVLWNPEAESSQKWNPEAESSQNASLQSTANGTGRPATRIAIYQLDNTRSRVSYRFLRTQLLSDQTRTTDEALNSLVQDERRRN